eukprot:scaffold7063_cov351-Pinguiococcus_pyrenoidosus.AAC.12
MVFATRSPTANCGTLHLYVGKVAGLYPEDPIDALKVDGYIDFADDFFMQIYVTFQRKKLNLPEYNEDEKKEAREHLANVTLPPLLQQMEDKLTENGTGWCVGNSCTIADLRWYVWGAKGASSAAQCRCDPPRVELKLEKES